MLTLMDAEYPMRINKYLALKNYSTRRGADELIAAGKVTINGRVAQLGDKVDAHDAVVVRGARKSYRYFAYNKPRGIITHSPQGNEREIADVVWIEGVFPIGRLDKDSSGLIILTDDGRVTDKLLSPDNEHEKEYYVTVREKLRPSFAEHMEKGVDIGDYKTKRCSVKVVGDRAFFIVLSEGKKHQIRRMCAAMHVDIESLQRVRIMRIKLGDLAPGSYRELTGSELSQFLSDLGLT